MSIYMIVATVAYAAMVLGILCRRRTRWHIPLMSTAIGIDVILVLLLELQRDAILTAVSFEMSAWAQVHIVASTLALLGYFPMVLLGIQLVRGSFADPLRWKDVHRRLGIVVFSLRSIGFVFMFSMLD